MKRVLLSYFLAVTLISSYSLMAYAAFEEDLQQLFSTGDYQAALSLIDLELERDRSNEKLLLAKGFSLVKLDRLDLAVAYYEKLKLSLSGRPEPGNNLAMVYNIQGKYRQAIEELNQTIEDFPDYGRAYENLGDTYINIAQYEFQRGLNKTGEEIFEKKIRLSQNFHQIATHLAPPQLIQPGNPEKRVGQVVSPFEPSSSPDVSAPEQAVFETLRVWSRDWMSLDYDRYLSHYSKQFTPDNDLTLEQWMELKKNMLSNAKYIKVSLSKIDIKVDRNAAFAWFIQKYESDRMNQTSSKLIKFSLVGDAWLITGESSKD